MPDTDKTIPPSAAIQVLRWRTNARTKELEPWPVATIHIDQAGAIQFTGDAGKAYEPLLRACRKAAAKLVDQSMREAMEEARQLLNKNPL